MWCGTWGTGRAPEWQLGVYRASSGPTHAGRFNVVSKIDDLSERWVEVLATRISGPEAIGAALFCYLGIGLAVPLARHGSVWAFVGYNVVGTSLAGLVVIAWLGVRVEAGHRRHLVEWTTELRHLDSTEFELLVGEVFRREGWSVDETGRPDGPDGNIDLELSKDGGRRIVQCKRWEAKVVGVDEIRRFLGTLLRERLTGEDGIFVTLSDFGEQARAEAKQAGLTLIDGHELMARVENVRRPELCPECKKPMRLAHSDYGWWLRCVSEGCRGKRDLGNEPGRAVELLLEG
jgi:restriction system protein